MASDCRDKKPLLYSDLFKGPRAEKEQHHSIVMSKVESSSSSSSWNHSWLSCDSSSSGFSTPLYSDMGSSESEDGDFIAELTRQMAECMLQEEDEEDAVQNCASEDSQASSLVLKDDNSNNEQNYGRWGKDRIPLPPIQVYELKNHQQHPVNKQCRGRRGRRGKRSESGQPQPQPQKTHQQQHRGRELQGFGHGSGMQAVFLGGSKSGSPGTGVFLPRVTTDSTEPKKKSGCPMVLMPTRVLQVLELHFNRVQESSVPSPSEASPNCLGPEDEPSRSHGRQSEHPQLDYTDEMNLPQEWTY